MADDVTYSGPFFDARYDEAMRRLIAQVEADIADHGRDIVRDALGTSIRVDGPGYAARHVATTTEGDRQIVDTNALYGPWLEGIGSRNAPRTRFPGYAAFRRSVQKVQERADAYAEPALARFVEEVD
jgi:hypothetical protein